LPGIAAQALRVSGIRVATVQPPAVSSAGPQAAPGCP